MRIINNTKSGRKHGQGLSSRLLLVGLLPVLFVGALVVTAMMPGATPALAHSAVGKTASCQDHTDGSCQDKNSESDDSQENENTDACTGDEGVFESYGRHKSRSECDLSLVKAVEGGDYRTVGQDVTFDLWVTNVSKYPISGSITVTDQVPAGLTNLSADGGSNWNIDLPAKSGPVAIKATYKGPFPVAAGQKLPAIKIRGVLTEAAVPSLTNVATVASPDDNNHNNDTSRKTLYVKGQHVEEIPTLPLTGSDPHQ